jgi:outer membrane protein TolC
MVTQHSSRTVRSIALTAALVTIAAPALSASDQQINFQAAQQQAQPAPQGAVLKLSMEDAVTMGLEANLGLKAQRLDIDIAAEGIRGARAAFKPLLSSSFGRTSSVDVPTSFTQGSADITNERMNVSGTVVQNLRWYGGGYSVTWASNRNTQVGGDTTFNPRLGSTLTINFNQPLWRDLRIDPNRGTLETSERQRAISDIQVQQRVVQTESNIRFAYLALIAAIEGRKVAQENMNIAEQSLANARASVAVGQAPEINIIQSQAEVERNREALLRSDVAISRAEDDLRTLILDPSRPDYWEVHLEATDTIQLNPREIDLNAAIKNALASRLDLTVVRRNLEIADLGIRVGRNATKPTVDFVATYSAQGTGGSRLVFDEESPLNPPPVIGRVDKGFGSVLNDTFGGTYPTWTVGLQMQYPIGNSAAHSNLAQQEIRKRQDLLSLRELELQIVRDVRDAARSVQNSYQRVLAARAALDASERQLEAEDRKFAAGVSTTLDLQFRQGQAAQARVNALQAMIDYNRALILFDRVQKTQ